MNDWKPVNGYSGQTADRYFRVEMMGPHRVFLHAGTHGWWIEIHGTEADTTPDEAQELADAFALKLKAFLEGLS